MKRMEYMVTCNIHQGNVDHHYIHQDMVVMVVYKNILGINMIIDHNNHYNQDNKCHHSKVIVHVLHKDDLLNFKDVIVGVIRKEAVTEWADKIGIMVDLGIKRSINVQVVVVINHEVGVEIGTEVGIIEIEIVIGNVSGIFLDHHIQIWIDLQKKA